MIKSFFKWWDSLTDIERFFAGLVMLPFAFVAVILSIPIMVVAAAVLSFNDAIDGISKGINKG
jgi:hypothetical protein